VGVGAIFLVELSVNVWLVSTGGRTSINFAARLYHSKSNLCLCLAADETGPGCG
jgi:hypothetical protein